MATMSFPPILPLILSHFDSYFLSSVQCLINVLSSFLLFPVRNSASCLSGFHFPPPPRFSRRPAWLHGDNRLSRLSLTPLLAPRAPATVVCSTLSHLTGHLHSVRKRPTPNLHVKSVFMNRSDRKNPAKTFVNGKDQKCPQCGNYT